MNHLTKFISDVHFSSFYTFDHWLGLGETCRMVVYASHKKTCMWPWLGRMDVNLQEQREALEIVWL